jgi:transposase
VDSRNRNGFKFRCLVCGHRGDADRIASINIRNRSVVTRHNLVATGSNNTPESTEPLDANSGLPGSNGSASLVLV